eukprot:Selendium_serpulae@DN4925_c0_g1_i7.p1
MSAVSQSVTHINRFNLMVEGRQRTQDTDNHKKSKHCLRPTNNPHECRIQLPSGVEFFLVMVGAQRPFAIAKSALSPSLGTVPIPNRSCAIPVCQTSSQSRTTLRSFSLSLFSPISIVNSGPASRRLLPGGSLTSHC